MSRKARSRFVDHGAAALTTFAQDVPLLLSSESHSEVELHFSCEALKFGGDLFSLADPFARLVLVEKDEEIELGRTEVIKNTTSPRWSNGIKCAYHFEESQICRLEVWDEDVKGSSNLNDHTFQGSCDFLLAEIMTSSDAALEKQLKKAISSTFGSAKEKIAGTVTIRGEEMECCSEYLQLSLCGRSLANKDGFFSKSDPYFEVLKVREDGTWIPIYRSIHLDNTLNPTWPVAKRISVQSLCNGDYDRPLKIDVWDRDKDGSHDAMGSVSTTLRQILLLSKVPVAEQKGLPVIETLTKRGKTKQKNSGNLYIREGTGVYKYHTFLDFIRDGWKLGQIIGIDFTGSNGNPASPSSLHYRNPHGVPNQYEMAITALAEVITAYDDDQIYPLYGFGGRGGAQNKVSHCFPLNGSDESPGVHGVDGILAAYAEALTKWGLSGPTVFSQIINAAAASAKAEESRNEKAYTLLLIITDGVITDFEATKEAIVAASGLPLSIIIVGVGEADFSAMEALDGDDERLADQHGRRAKRDIVQFVAMRDYVKSGGAPMSAYRLAKATLEELPAQMLGYFTSKKINPGKGKTIEMSAQTAGDAAGLNLGLEGKQLLRDFVQ